jgi:hypothetical protein
MTTSTEARKRSETSLARDWINFLAYRLRPYLGGRRGLIILSVSALAVGGFLSWDWLVAVGLAPLIIAVAPCAVMCALGLCMSRMGGQSCSSQSSAAESQSDARSSLSDLDTVTKPQPVVSLSNQTAGDLAEGPSEASEEQAAARGESEAASEKR